MPYLYYVNQFDSMYSRVLLITSPPAYDPYPYKKNVPLRIAPQKREIQHHQHH